MKGAFVVFAAVRLRAHGFMNLAVIVIPCITIVMSINCVGATDVNRKSPNKPHESSVELRATGRKQPAGSNVVRSGKRERLEIMAEILFFCSRQRAKTNIMYETNLNYAQLKNHLKSLTSQRLLIQEKGKYATTEKGHRFLESYARLQEILKDEDV